ncbi:MAG: TonB-dependent receptor [Bacteroidales bacterium]|nr:TonB-dependent receptor [Bacteroidales bacterium]
MRIRFLIALVFLSLTAVAQQLPTGLLYGKVTDEQGHPIEMANVIVPELLVGQTTNTRGYYELSVLADTSLTVHFSFVGYEQKKVEVRLKIGEKRKLDVTLASTATVLPDAVISDRGTDASSLTRLNAKQATLLPSMGGGVETLIKTLPGVVSNNELSSQYRVRGGNFDENLIYVNGIEIYRPFLVGSGQQEGLSFVNSQLVNNIEFSAGGFAAEYGDKMSSVLDVTYKTPKEATGSLTLSLLGAEAHVEGITKNEKFSYLVGLRYKNTALALGLMDTKGDYRPNFADGQALLNYQLNEKWGLSFLGYYSKNRYMLIPQNAKINTGTIDLPLQINVYFDGQEVDDYTTGLGALTLAYKPNKDLNLRWIASAYSTYETETFDLQEQYFFGIRNSSIGSEDFGEVIENHEVGTLIKHARNGFYAQVYNLDHKGLYATDNQLLKWGLRFQYQDVDDVVDEWQMMDSAGYALPHVPDVIGGYPDILPEIGTDFSHKTHNILSVNNLDGYVQNSWTLPYRDKGELVIMGGLRANYWSYNNKVYVSPRAGIAYKPEEDKREMVYRLSGGVYSQTPFYREIRNRDGSLFKEAKAQQSYQIVAGNDLKFHAWSRPFILTSELYFKWFTHVIPYDVDNVRIRYYADQSARAYTTGLDFKVNGEFVKGIDSWASLSFMRAREDIRGDYYLIDTDGNRLPFYNHTDDQVADTVALGWHFRPSNQLINFSLFFQDYIPSAPTWRVNMTLTFGMGLPQSDNNSDFYSNSGRYPAYRRVDIGFSKQLISEASSFSKGNPLRYVKNMFVSVDVFNLLDIPNVISYTWVKYIDNRYYGAPNYLTPRYVNVKLVMEF